MLKLAQKADLLAYDKYGKKKFTYMQKLLSNVYYHYVFLGYKSSYITVHP